MNENDRYAISRIDQPASGTHGWQVRIARGGRRISKFFSDARWGGAEAGFEAAREFRNRLVEDLPAADRPAAEGKLTRRNVSGVVGVSRIVVRTIATRYVFWQATWSPEPGVRRRVKFSITRYGEERAFELACRARREGEGGERGE
jgi:hypothetical protein